MSVETVWRWCRRGVRHGVRLRSVVVGGRRLTTRRWLQEFIQALTQAAGTAPNDVPMPRTPHQRQAEADRATEELKRLWGRGG